MKICFIYNKDNDKYIRLVKDIYSYFKENGSKVKLSNMLYESEAENSETFTKSYRTKNDIFIFFSDSAQELKESYEQFKRPVKTMIITENLTVEYIMLCTDIAKNICYSKKDIPDICSRIEVMYEKYTE